jgi:hypothetical protein
MSGIVSFHNGFPFNIQVPSDNANIGDSSQRPSISSPLLPAGFKQTPNLWFDPSGLFIVPYTYGNLGRNVLRQDGLQNFDFSLSKRTPIHEAIVLEFRAEFFNILNHANFGPPGTSFGSSGFAEVRSLCGTCSPRDIQFALKLNF